jgi:putative cardiolipin synthase
MRLYIIRSDAGALRKPGEKSIFPAEPKAALHAKAAVFDRQSAFIGSYNLDPKFRDINTETGLYAENSELTAQVINYKDDGGKPANSYRVLLDEKDNLVWSPKSTARKSTMARSRKAPSGSD